MIERKNVKDGKTFSQYLKENDLSTSYQSEKMLANVRSLQQSIENILSMSERQEKLYNALNEYPKELLLDLQQQKEIYIRLALTQCISNKDIPNLTEWQLAMKEARKKVRSTIAILCVPMSESQLEAAEKKSEGVLV